MQNQNKRVMNYIPVKVNLSGVIPPIFASAVLMFPLTMLQASSNSILTAIADTLAPGGVVFNIATFFLVIFFAFFYASIAFNAKDIADNLKRQGGFIPGVRPGKKTAEFLDNVLTKLTLPGSILLGLVAIIPYFLTRLFGVSYGYAAFYGGTGLLIIVGVALDTLQQIESHLYMRHYDGFLKGSKIKGRR